MAAECFWCVSKLVAIASPLGDIAVPIGCCSKCQVFCCGHHAQRDTRILEYLCLECDTKLIRATAAKIAEEEGETELAAELRISNGVFGNWDTFDTYEEFKQRRPGYKDWFAQIEGLKKDQILNSKYREYLFGANDDVRLMTIATAYLEKQILRGEKPDDNYPPLLRAIINAFSEERRWQGGMN